MKKITLNTKVVIALLMPTTLIMAGCNNNELFKKVQNLSSNATTLSETFPSIAKDVYDSCIRTADHETIQPDSTPFDKRTNAYNMCNQPLGTVQDPDTKQTIDITRKDYEETLIGANAVIVSYLQALDAVAQGVSYTANIEKLGQSVQRLAPTLSPQGVAAGQPVLSDEEVKAGQTILEFIINAATSQYRRDTLNREIQKTNEPLQKYICGLKKRIVTPYVTTDLKIELDTVDKYYQDYIKRELEVDKSTQEQQYLIQQYLRQVLQQEPLGERTLSVHAPASIIEIDRQWFTARENIRQKASKARDYIDILDIIANAHSDLDKYLGGQGISQQNVCLDFQWSVLFVKTNNSQFAPIDKGNKTPEEIVSLYLERLEMLLNRLESYK